MYIIDQWIHQKIQGYDKSSPVTFRQPQQEKLVVRQVSPRNICAMVRTGDKQGATVEALGMGFNEPPNY